MLIGLLIIPAILSVIGGLWRKKPPAKVNWIYGYRSWFSMKNQDTWDFAHNYISELWSKTGPVLAVVSAGYYLVISGSDARTVQYLVGRMTLVQMAVIFVSIAMTEIALRQKFDKDGNPN